MTKDVVTKVEMLRKDTVSLRDKSGRVLRGGSARATSMTHQIQGSSSTVDIKTQFFTFSFRRCKKKTISDGRYLESTPRVTTLW